MTKAKRWLAMGAMLLGSIVGPIAMAAPASAYPSSCYVLMSGNRNGYSNCTQGTGQHRVVLYCKNTTVWGGVTRFGEWRGVNQQSWASCPWGTVITQISPQIR